MRELRTPYSMSRTMTNNHLFHITTAEEAAGAMETGKYSPRRFEEEGFIHCSYVHQITRVANLRFREQTGLVLLQIDPVRLDSRVVEENLEGGNELFPHIYGRLPMKAVVKIHGFPCSRDGIFKLPADLSA